MKKEEEKNHTTKFGEFVPTFHAWVSFEEQDKRARYLANITKSKK